MMKNPFFLNLVSLWVLFYVLLSVCVWTCEDFKLWPLPPNSYANILLQYIILFGNRVMEDTFSSYEASMRGPDLVWLAHMHKGKIGEWRRVSIQGKHIYDTYKKKKTGLFLQPSWGTTLLATWSFISCV